MSKLVECVPNFSEGRDRAVIEAIAGAIRGVAGVELLDVDPGADTNRTVYTFVGPPEAVSDAALAGARKAAELIDMSRHSGAHPRMGALDVCPIVPVAGVTMDECVEIARALGRRLADALQVPVYLYEYAAASPGRKSLADIRAGEYRGPRAQAAGSRLGPRLRPRDVQPAPGRDGRRGARVPPRLQREPEHPRPPARPGDRPQHPRGGAPEARRPGAARARGRRHAAEGPRAAEGRPGDRLVHRGVPGRRRCRSTS